MTVLTPCARTWSVKVLSRSNYTLTRLISTNASLRVSQSHTTKNTSTRPQRDSLSLLSRCHQVRTFADGKPGRPAGRPKAHTGRTTAKRATQSTPTKKATTKSKPAPKPKKKAKAKPKPKPKKKELSATAKKRMEAKERSELRKTALLTGAPKALPNNAWTLYFVENGPKKGQPVDRSGSAVKAAAQAYKNISADERERLNHTASQNKAKNEVAHKKWVQSFEPLRIKQANHARDLLRQEAKKAGKKTLYTHIKDDRLVKMPATQYSLFLKDRYNSGDMKGMTVNEASKLIAREWKDLNAAEKKAYNERFSADRNRYQEEFKTVYGIDSPSASISAATAA